MTAVFVTNDIYRIEAEAWRHFECHPLASGRDNQKRSAKRNKVSKVLDKYFDAMNSASPPLTKEQAVEVVSPFFALLLSLFIKQLTVLVIEWLWERTH